MNPTKHQPLSKPTNTTKHQQPPAETTKARPKRPNSNSKTRIATTESRNPRPKAQLPSPRSEIHNPNHKYQHTASTVCTTKQNNSYKPAAAGLCVALQQQRHQNHSSRSELSAPEAQQQLSRTRVHTQSSSRPQRGVTNISISSRTQHILGSLNRESHTQMANPAEENQVWHHSASLEFSSREEYPWTAENQQTRHYKRNPTDLVFCIYLF